MQIETSECSTWKRIDNTVPFTFPTLFKPENVHDRKVRHDSHVIIIILL